MPVDEVPVDELPVDEVLVEDRGAGTMSYFEFLVALQKAIQKNA